MAKMICDECEGKRSDCRQCGGAGELTLIECEFSRGEHVHYRCDEDLCLPARFDFAFIRKGVPWFRAIAEGQAMLGGELAAITRCTHPWQLGIPAFLGDR